MSKSENAPAAGNESRDTLNNVEQGLSHENGEKLVPAEKYPLLTLTEEQVMVPPVDEEESTIPAEDPSVITPIENGRMKISESKEVKSEAVTSPPQIETDIEINKSAKEVPVMNTTGLPNQEAVQANVADSEPMPSENKQPAPAELTTGQLESEEVVGSEDDAEAGNSGGFLDIFREEEKENDEIFSQTLEEVDIDSLLGDANQVFNKINSRRGRTG